MKKKIILLGTCIVGVIYLYLGWVEMMQKKAQEEKINQLEQTFSLEQKDISSSDGLDNL